MGRDAAFVGDYALDIRLCPAQVICPSPILQSTRKAVIFLLQIRKKTSISERQSMLFGSYPAAKASGLQPIEALRAE